MATSQAGGVAVCSNIKMNLFLKRFLFSLLALFVGIFSADAAKVIYEGYVKDSVTGETLPYATITYKNSPFGTETDLQGFYQLEVETTTQRYLEISYLGYKNKILDLKKFSSHRINILLSPEAIALGPVEIKASRREKYRRKENPAVELMKKVIANRDSNDVRSTDFYSVNRYEKYVFGINNFKIPQDSAKRERSAFSYLFQYVDTSEVSGKPYLPFSLRENLSSISSQASPYKSKQTIYAQNNKILMNVLNEEMIDLCLAQGFADVQIYDNNVNLFLIKFVSPLSTLGTTFYHYFIADTVTMDDGDRCVEMTFVPANTNDMGFTGTMFILLDSSYAVKQISMDTPRDIKLNIVDKLHVEQEFFRTPDGKYALKHERMVSELSLVDGLQGIYGRRDAYYNDYQWHDVDKSIFDRPENVVVNKDAKRQDDDVWTGQRSAALTEKENSIDDMANHLNKKKWFKLSEYLIRSCFEGYMPVGKNGYWDYGPVMSTYTSNYLEGPRVRIGGRTNPALNDRLFLDAYAAYGFRDEEWKYKGELEYSFRDRKVGKSEFPRHSVMVNYVYDVEVPSERFLGEGGSSLVRSLKRERVKQFAYVRSQTAKYIHEYDNGFSYSLSLKHQQEEAAAELEYRRVCDSSFVKNIETSVFGVELSFAPGVKYYQNKTNRYVMNMEVPRFKLTHQVASKGLLGSQFDYNKTEFTYNQEIFLTPLGYVDVTVKAGKVWNRVPYPLLLIPPANRSYLIADESFWMMNNMEFLTDQCVMAELAYNMDGLILGRIPGLRKLSLKEMVRFRALYGSLSDKNNPAKNPDNEMLFYMPRNSKGEATTFLLGDVPYMEVCVGIHNIFKIFRIEAVRRLNYFDHYDKNKWGVNFGVGLHF